jgi:hypothetical protein
MMTVRNRFGYVPTTRSRSTFARPPRREELERRNRRIIALALAGMPPRKIRETIGTTISASVITWILVKARAAGFQVPRFPPGQSPAEAPATPVAAPAIEDGLPADLDARLGLRAAAVTATFPPDLVAELAAPAARRGMTVRAFVIHLVTIAVADDLIEAILDDGLDPRPTSAEDA